jgi:hypothetical protein
MHEGSTEYLHILHVLYKGDAGHCFTYFSFVFFFFFAVPVCAITASGVPGGTFVSMNRFSTLCG